MTDLNVEQQIERPEIKIIPKRDMLAKDGITLPEFAEMINVLWGGEVVSQVYEGNRSFDLTLKVADDKRESMERIKELMIDADGSKVPLSNAWNMDSCFFRSKKIE